MRNGTNTKKKQSTMIRLIKYIFAHNKVGMTVVIICLFFSAVASSASGVFLYFLIDNIITPAVANGFSSVAGSLIALTISMACVYGLGILCSLIYSFIMAKLGQSTLLLRAVSRGRRQPLVIAAVLSTGRVHKSDWCVRAPVI